MSIFGWSVTQQAPPAAPPREIYDPIFGVNRKVSTTTTTSREAVFTRVPQPPAPREPTAAAAGATAGVSSPSTARVPAGVQWRNRGSNVADLLHGASSAGGGGSPRYVRAYRDSAVVDATPSTFLALSHAYNRRVFSRGSMRAASERPNLVSAHADSKRNFNVERTAVMSGPSALLNPYDATSLRKLAAAEHPEAAKGPGSRFTPRPVTRAMSDGMAAAAAAGGGQATAAADGGDAATPRHHYEAATSPRGACTARSHQRHCAPHMPPPGSARLTPASSRPQTARECISRVAAEVKAVEYAQRFGSLTSSSRPLSARTAHYNNGPTPLAGAFGDGTNATAYSLSARTRPSTARTSNHAALGWGAKQMAAESEHVADLVGVDHGQAALTTRKSIDDFERRLVNFR